MKMETMERATTSAAAGVPDAELTRRNEEMKYAAAAAKYASELATLRINSKPIINSLTMMAEDYIKAAKNIVSVIENHLARAHPDVKLPVLYLIDSIIKNVKRVYIPLFAKNIATTFCGAFERVNEKTRAQMYKLRQTWFDIFPAQVLLELDMKARSIDPAWPISTTNKLKQASIHVNPKFLHVKLASTSSPKAEEADEAASQSAADIDDEVRMREELLIKQKELIELQQKKLELELLQTQAKLAEKARLKAKKEADKEEKEKLLKQAEIAKQRTSMAATIIAKASEAKAPARSSPPSNIDKTSNQNTSSSSSSTTSPKTESAEADELAELVSDPRSKPTRISHVKSEKQSSPSPRLHSPKPKDVDIKEEKKSPKSKASDRNDSPDSTKVSKKTDSSSDNNKKPKRTQSEPSDRSDSESKKKDEKRDHSKLSHRHDSPKRVKDSPVKKEKESPKKSRKDRDSSRERSRSKSESKSPEKRGKGGERSSPSREREHSGSADSRSSRERDRVESGGSSSSKRSSPLPRKINKGPEDNKISLDHRRSAVLSKSYRKRPDDIKAKKETESASATGDTDLRFTGLRDTDLRRTTDPASSEEPSNKKPRRSAVIEDLFGQEDVDLRQPAGSNWAQMKKPTTTLETSEAQEPELSLQRKKAEGDQEDIHQLLNDSGNRPPSPSNSIDSNLSACDTLGRPLLFSRLPAKPEDRKRELDTRSMSIDAAEQFRSRYLGRPGGPSDTDLKLALAEATIQLDSGILTPEQHGLIMKELVQLNEIEKIRQVQEMRNTSLARLNVPSPWAANNPWAMTSGQGNFLPRTGDFTGTRLPTPWAPTVNQWPVAPIAPPSGPNPFIEAAIQSAPPEDLIPDANPMELKIAERNSYVKIPLDQVTRSVRFYGDTTIIFIDRSCAGIFNEEPYEISFQQSRNPKIIYINKIPFKCFIGETKIFYLDKQKYKHTIKIGTPKRELIIDGEPYEANFTGAPIRVKLNGRLNSFSLEGPPPSVEIGKEARYDLVAGRVTLYIDSISTHVYLDELPQVIELGNVPVIFRFCNNFHSFALNGRVFPANFGGQPMSVTLRSARQHFLRLAGVSQHTEAAMKEYIRIRKMEKEIANEGFFGGGGRGRGRGRAGPGRGGPPPRNDEFEGSFRAADSSRLEENPLDMLATIFPSTETKESGNQNNSYKSETAATAGTDSKDGSAGGTGSLNVQDLLSKLMMAGLLPTAEKKEDTKPKEGTTDSKEEVKESTESKSEESPMDTSEAEVKPKVEEKPGPPPLEVVDMTFKDNLKERRIKLVNQICTGMQCAACGLRFAPDQSLRYTQHLDWHFRLNRREKANARKAQSRRWYYDLSDWIQFEEIEDLEERAASLFEFQEPEKADGDEKEASTVLNPEAYTVLSSAFPGPPLCPQCGEGFEEFYEEEEEEWRLKNALAEKEPEGEPRLFHPICHEEYAASLAKQQANESMEESLTEGGNESTETSEKVAQEPAAPEPIEMDVTDMLISQTDVKEQDNEEEEEDEVLILKEGKKEVVLMEIALEEEDDEQVVDNSSSSEAVIKPTSEPVSKDSANETESAHTSSSVTNPNNNNKSVLSPIVIQVEDDIIPGITTSASQGNEGSGVFDFALNSSSDSQQSKQQELAATITYNSMQFDFPKIKVEPPEWDELDENQIIMSKEFLVNENQTPMDITLDDDDSPSPPRQPSHSQEPASQNIDIDLTGDDEDSSQGLPMNAIVAAIDGNLEMSGGAKVPVSMPTKIRINISGLDNKPSESQSPNHQTTSSQEEPRKSPNPTQQSTTGPEDSVSGDNNKLSIDNIDNNEKVLEEIKRLKPRLVGKKLVNCPPKKTGKEESGLCVIS